MNGTFVITRDLTLQVYSQLLSVRADYGRYATLDDRSRETRVTYDDAAADFSRTDLRLQGLLRWEYLPGAALFLVYTRFGFAELSVAAPRMSDSLGRLDSGEHEQLVMLKISHRFD